VSEKHIFEVVNATRHPFLVNLVGCFQMQVAVAVVIISIAIFGDTWYWNNPCLALYVFETLHCFYGNDSINNHFMI